jgi:ketosteroid isomerase-like protein
MSWENVEIVRAFQEAWNAGNMEAVRELWHPDAIVRPAPGWPEPGPFVGRDSIMRSFEQLRETWDADTFQIEGDIRAVADRVIGRMVWRGVGHGPDMDMHLTQILTIRDGTIFGMESFWDHAEALEAVGLRE